MTIGAIVDAVGDGHNRTFPIIMSELSQCGRAICATFFFLYGLVFSLNTKIFSKTNPQNVKNLKLLAGLIQRRNKKSQHITHIFARYCYDG